MGNVCSHAPKQRNNVREEITMKFPVLLRDQIFPRYKAFGGRTFKMSPLNPMALEYCTETRAEGNADKIRKLGVNARIAKKRWDGGRVAHVVYFSAREK
jgi:hypothetical protein